MEHRRGKLVDDLAMQALGGGELVHTVHGISWQRTASHQHQHWS